MTDSIHIMLIEDTPAYRKVIAMALEDEEDLHLQDTFGTAEVALRMLQNAKKEEQPDIILLDLRLPGMDGLHAITWIQKYAPSTRILILTQSDKDKDVMTAIKNGASGYFLKSASVHEITEGIRHVAKGGASLGSGISKLLMDKLRDRIPDQDIEHELSPREIQTLTLLSRGRVKKEIAEELNIGYSTVDTYVKKIYEKLEVNNAAAAVSKGYNLGLIQLSRISDSER